MGVPLCLASHIPSVMRLPCMPGPSTSSRLSRPVCAWYGSLEAHLQAEPCQEGGGGASSIPSCSDPPRDSPCPTPGGAHRPSRTAGRGGLKPHGHRLTAALGRASPVAFCVTAGAVAPEGNRYRSVSF